MNVKTAFLNGDLSEEIYMELLEGAVCNEEEIQMGFKLNKSLFRTRQASRCWIRKINRFHVDELGLTQNKGYKGDPCICARADRRNIVLLALYFDDLLVAASCSKQIYWIKSKENDSFQMRDIGEARLCLGMGIKRNKPEQAVFFPETKYANAVLEWFRMNQCKPSATPKKDDNQPNSQLKCSNDGQMNSTENFSFKEALRRLMYLMTRTRPGSAFAVLKLAQFCGSPQQKHWNAVKKSSGIHS